MSKGKEYDDDERPTGWNAVHKAVDADPAGCIDISCNLDEIFTS